MNTLAPITDNAAAAQIKACCAAVYGSDWARFLLGDSFHPGGLALTQRLATMTEIGPGQRVLDVAAGTGTSALYLAEQFGWQVIGLEYSGESLAAANRAAAEAGLADRVRFEQGDAERLPFASATFDAVICECAFCTFPDKRSAAAEIARVLRPGGRLGLSDLTCSGPLPPELDGLLAWIACIADARPVAQYGSILEAAGLTVRQIESHDKALSQLVGDIQAKLLGAELFLRLKKIELPEVDFGQAKALARSAAETVRQGTLGYALLAAVRD